MRTGRWEKARKRFIDLLLDRLIPLTFCVNE
jgi:hypothetical protein